MKNPDPKNFTSKTNLFQFQMKISYYSIKKDKCADENNNKINQKKLIDEPYFVILL